MGINRRIIRVLEHARGLGVDMDRTAMIGRQQIHLSEEQFRKSLIECEFDGVDPLVAETFEADRYAEPLFRAMGATTVDSVDASEYEGANVIVDMNHPVGSELHEKYSFVLDGGSLEHIFCFPTAIKNCMEMVEVGGHLFSINGTNNFSGHGFYQFSPELMFRVLSPENGFEVVEMLLWERTENANVYRVRDPEEVGGRVMPKTTNETFLTVIAKRTHVTEIFATTPQQSDYVVDWNNNHNRPPGYGAQSQPALKRFGKRAEKYVRDVRKALFPRSKYRPDHYEPIDWRKSA